MSIEATATALAEGGQTAAPEAETLTEDQILDAAYDKMQEAEDQDNQTPDEPEDDEIDEVEGDEPDADDVDEETDGGDDTDEDEPDAGPVKAPSELPRAIKEAWADIPEAARDAIVEAQREANRKLSEQGRLVQGISPIRDVLVQAARDLPALAGMKPAEVAQDVMQLARMSHSFTTQPIETMMDLIRQHGLEQAMAQALQGQPVADDARQSNVLRNEIAVLKRQLAQVSDPEYLRSQVHAFTTESQTESEVNQFAAQAEHWSEVENYIPQAIPLVRAKLGESASPKDVLKAAYDLAVSQFVPEVQKVKSPPAAAKAAKDAPEKTEAARNAKSVNVTSRPGNKPRKMTVDEALDDAWRRMQNQ